MAANVDHRVDRARSAKAFAARLITRAAVQSLLRDGFIFVIGRIADERHEAGRLDQHVIVIAACLNQADCIFATFGQSSGGCAACGTTANNNDVKFVHNAYSLFERRFKRTINYWQGCK